MADGSGIKMVVIRPWSGLNHLVAFYKDVRDKHSPVRAVYFGWAGDGYGYHIEMSTSANYTYPDKFFETKAEMEAWMSEIIGVSVTVDHDGP